MYVFYYSYSVQGNTNPRERRKPKETVCYIYSCKYNIMILSFTVAASRAISNIFCWEKIPKSSFSDSRNRFRIFDNTNYYNLILNKLKLIFKIIICTYNLNLIKYHKNNSGDHSHAESAIMADF